MFNVMGFFVSSSCGTEQTLVYEHGSSINWVTLTINEHACFFNCFLVLGCLLKIAFFLSWLITKEVNKHWGSFSTVLTEQIQFKSDS